MGHAVKIHSKEDVAKVQKGVCPKCGNALSLNVIIDVDNAPPLCHATYDYDKEKEKWVLSDAEWLYTPIDIWCNTIGCTFAIGAKCIDANDIAEIGELRRRRR